MKEKNYCDIIHFVYLNTRVVIDRGGDICLFVCPNAHCSAAASGKISVHANIITRRSAGAKSTQVMYTWHASSTAEFKFDTSAATFLCLFVCLVSPPFQRKYFRFLFGFDWLTISSIFHSMLFWIKLDCQLYFVIGTSSKFKPEHLRIPWKCCRLAIFYTTLIMSEIW